MYGLINEAVKDLLITKFGIETWEKVYAEAKANVGAELGDVYDSWLGMMSYPDELTYALVAAAAKVLALPASEVLRVFGEWWLLYTAQSNYGDILEMSGQNLPEFLGNLNALHTSVLYRIPGLDTPQFWCTSVDEAKGVMLFHYRPGKPSRAGLSPLVIGILEGLAKKFAISLKIDHVMKRDDGADHDCFFLSWEALNPLSPLSKKAARREKRGKKKKRKEKKGSKRKSKSSKKKESDKDSEPGTPKDKHKPKEEKPKDEQLEASDDSTLTSNGMSLSDSFLRDSGSSDSPMTQSGDDSSASRAHKKKKGASKCPFDHRQLSNHSDGRGDHLINEELVRKIEGLQAQSMKMPRTARGEEHHTTPSAPIPNLGRRRNSVAAPSPSTSLLKQLQAMPLVYSSSNLDPGNYSYVIRSKSGTMVKINQPSLSSSSSPAMSPCSSASSSLNTSPRSYSPRVGYSQINMVRPAETHDSSDSLFVHSRNRRRFGQSYELPQGALDDLFPFHLVLNNDMTILRYGPVLQRICGLGDDVSPVERFNENWKFVRPDIVALDVQQLARYYMVFNDTVTVKHVPSGLELKYQLLFGQQSSFNTTQNYVYLLGSPVLKDAAEAHAFEISFKDFPLHDATKELLLKSQMDSSLMVDALSFQKRTLTLEEAVKQLETEQERTKQLLRFQQEQNKELEKARDLANKAAQLKAHFLSNMSHEIRTPMNAIIGMTELLLQTELDEQQKESAQLVFNAGEILLSIINDILDFSKIEAGKLGLEMAPFNLHECVNGVCDILDLRAFEKGLQLYSLIPVEAPRYVFGDCRRLQQVMINLLNNAIKFTNEGEVFVKLVVLDDNTPSPYPAFQQNSVTIQFEVTDTGIGIAPEDFPALFQAFTQLDTKNRCGGTGLGLAIAKQLVELMHGEVTLNSTLGQGSTFSFTAVFPLAAEEDLIKTTGTVRSGLPPPLNLRAGDSTSGDAHSPPEPPKSGRRRSTTSDTPTPTPMSSDRSEVTESPDGQAFLKLKRRMSQALTPNWRTPKGSPPPEELWQAPAMETIVATATTAPPTNGSKANTSTSSTLPVTANNNIKKGGEKKKQILVAEDNLTNQKVISRMLDKLGYTFDMVADGVDALKAVGLGSYSLLLLDIHMPRMGGLEASSAIRRLDRGLLPRQPAIIALSAEVLEGVEASCLSAGMDGYLSKPVRMEQLRQVISRFIV